MPSSSPVSLFFTILMPPGRMIGFPAYSLRYSYSDSFG
jgi:hypothetical protein